MKAAKEKTKLILVCGLPGTGKTTVAEAIAAKTKAYVLSTDVIRKEIIDKPEYSEKEKELVYNLIFGMAQQMLGSSKSVLVDGTFYRKDLRDNVREIADAMKSEFIVVEVVCDESVIRKRLDRRCKTCCTSDADFSVYQKLKKSFEPIKEKHFTIDTSSEWKKEIDALIKKL
jgi:hypothetical protein